MVKFGADENFNLLIIKGLKRRKLDLDIIEDLLVIAEFTEPEEWKSRIEYLPL